jgi:alpha-tubulin suppressor-like RCC1 family protein
MTIGETALRLPTFLRREPDADWHGRSVVAVLATAKVSCWGYNGYGELRNGTTTNSDVPLRVLSVSNATAVSGGYLGTCALLSTSTVKFWGYNNDGELGNGSTTGRPFRLP